MCTKVMDFRGNLASYLFLKAAFTKMKNCIEL